VYQDPTYVLGERRVILIGEFHWTAIKVVQLAVEPVMEAHIPSDPVVKIILCAGQKIYYPAHKIQY
jgi:hypothetical protein